MQRNGQADPRAEDVMKLSRAIETVLTKYGNKFAALAGVAATPANSATTSKSAAPAARIIPTALQSAPVTPSPGAERNAVRQAG